MIFKMKKHITDEKTGIFYTLRGKLNAYLAQIGCDAQKIFDLFNRQLVEQEDVTETLKAENQMDWIRRMNSICSRTSEIDTLAAFERPGQNSMPFTCAHG